jgi:hypothetical protein
MTSANRSIRIPVGFVTDTAEYEGAPLRKCDHRAEFADLITSWKQFVVNLTLDFAAMK